LYPFEVDVIDSFG